MPLLIWSKVDDKLDPSMKKKAYAFLEKLSLNDALPGLHIEPIKGAIDPRVRTGRVDDNFRTVLFKIEGTATATYVVHGTWPHDKANYIAQRVRLSMNPINGVPEVERVINDLAQAARTTPTAEAAAPAMWAVNETTPSPAPVREPAPKLLRGPAPGQESRPAQRPAPGQPQAPTVVPEAAPVRWAHGITSQALHAELGINPQLASAAVAASNEEALLKVLDQARVEWQALALLELATGSSLKDVKDAFDLGGPVDVVKDDRAAADQLVESLIKASAAARVSFKVVESNAELRQIIESGDFGAWRVFLHPEQRKYVTGHYNGAFRLSGGAGTGKTVVAVHRAAELARRDPQARILLTTFTRNLSDDLIVQLRRLDEDLRPAGKLGQTGILVRGIDALAWAVVQQAGDSMAPIAELVLGAGRTGVLAVTRTSAWREAIADAGGGLPAPIANQSFLEAEYAMVVLPGRITTEQQYLRARRQGRGVALSRARRIEVWKVVQAYRDVARQSDSTDFGEKAVLAATWLRENQLTFFDHILVDEGQDLSPAHLLLLRALVADGPNDLFLAEDSHQRIYGNKLTLSKYGVNIRGRSRRLTLNYRTTAQNLHWAMRILSGGEYVDLEGDTEKHEYRSSRSGPMPVMVHASSPSDELDQAAERIRSWLPSDRQVDTGRAPAPETIAVLVRDKYRRDTVVNGLHERGVEVRSVDRETPKPGKPLVMTMHRAKGLEFTHVLMFDVQEGAIPRALKDYDASPEDKADALLRERSLLYVAATRARDLLAISWHGKSSPLLD